MKESFNREQKDPYEGFKAGDVVFNPTTERNCAVTFVGDTVYHFNLASKQAASHALWYEAIEGSDEFKTLAADPRFKGEVYVVEPSVEIEWQTDLESRRMVVPVSKMNELKKVSH